MWGCDFEANRNETEAVLMKCDDGELIIRYNADWDFHIYQIVTEIEGKRDRYHKQTLKHAQKKTICGNDVEFHRYYLGINVRVVHMRNYNITGLFSDSRCLARSSKGRNE